MYVSLCMKSFIGTVCIKWKGLDKERNFITKKEVIYKKWNFITQEELT
jgi:hypothetical protein